MVRKGTTIGLWLASVGAMLQVVALGWDTVQHSLDPQLAAREGIVTLTNLSHLLTAVGLGMTVAGLLLLLALTGWRRRPAGPIRPARLLAGAMLGLLFLVTGGLAVAGGGLGGRGSAALASGAEGARHGAAGGSQVLASPTFAGLQDVLRTRGLDVALARLEELAATDERVLVVAHDYAHALGKASLAQYGSAATAFGLCRETFQSGCYHGVLEAHLEANPGLGTTELADLCDAGLNLDGAAGVVRFQCLHGLGHGLTGNFDHDLPRALRTCDALKTEWDRGSCYSGAFMENILFVTRELATAAAERQAGREPGAEQFGYLRPDDPLYPCNVLDERYKSECFVMQTSAMLMFNGNDFAKAMAECDRAGSYAHLCYQSIGRDASSQTYRDPQRSLEICLAGNPTYIGYCLLGTAKNMIDVTWKIDEAVALCGGAPSDYKGTCYQAIGEELATIHPDPAARARECSRVERDYIVTCNRAAGLLRPF